MELPVIRNELNTAYGLDLPETVDIEALETILADRINTLINKDFSALVQLLYRIDVSEPDLRKLLTQRSTEVSGSLIAKLILERSWQKILTRRMFSGNISNQKGESSGETEERW
jgi:hypothetical protein